MTKSEFALGYVDPESCGPSFDMNMNSIQDPQLDALEDALSDEYAEEEVNVDSIPNNKLLCGPQKGGSKTQAKKKKAKNKNSSIAAKAVCVVAQQPKKRGPRKQKDNKVRRPYKSYDDARIAKKYEELSARLDVANKRQSVLQLKHDRYKFEIECRKNQEQ
jgi:hypothetical protein